MSLINEDELRKEIKAIIKKENKIKKEDADEIINRLIPIIDEMISDRVKFHFKALSKKILEIF